jgi:uncharacterized protein (TIGR00269 family)
MKVSCSKCGGSAAVYLPYGNENLCKKHFVESFEKRVRRTVREFDMIRKGDRIGAVVYGGSDSASMLYTLKDICDSMRVELVAVSVDEGIRGYCEATIKVARENCKKLGVKHKTLYFKKEMGITADEIARKVRSGVCSYCEVFRDWILNKAAREMSLTKLAVGDNLDDELQSMLVSFLGKEPLRLAQPCSGGVAEHKLLVDRIKPLMKIPEREIAVYSTIKNMSTKPGRCPYAHEAFRDEVKAFLNETEEKFPGAKFGAFNSFMGMRGALGEKFNADETQLICKECGEPSSKEICVRCQMLKELR